MKVRCIEIYDSNERKPIQKNSWLTINKEYVVIQILCFSAKGVSYRLLDDSEDNSPGIYSANQFEIINTKKASNWDVTIKNNGLILIGPKAWTDNGFWERCYDGDISALEIYKREARIILSE